MFRAAHDSVVWAVVDNAASANLVLPWALRCTVGHRNLNYLHRKRHYRLDLAGEILSNENRKMHKQKLLVKCLILRRILLMAKIFYRNLPRDFCTTAEMYILQFCCSGKAESTNADGSLNVYSYRCTQNVKINQNSFLLSNISHAITMHKFLLFFYIIFVKIL